MVFRPRWISRLTGSDMTVILALFEPLPQAIRDPSDSRVVHELHWLRSMACALLPVGCIFPYILGVFFYSRLHSWGTRGAVASCARHWRENEGHLTGKSFFARRSSIRSLNHSNESIFCFASCVLWASAWGPWIFIIHAIYIPYTVILFIPGSFFFYYYCRNIDLLLSTKDLINLLCGFLFFFLCHILIFLIGFSRDWYLCRL